MPLNSALGTYVLVTNCSYVCDSPFISRGHSQINIQIRPVCLRDVVMWHDIHIKFRQSQSQSQSYFTTEAMQ
jgi:hypothetical protein